ncbi:MAG: hypothetical protein FD161_2072 [Limisphaerales bacterium]|nr:MAG: hypothetical protein FD161_2072 [Limisphaerales bacterium]KAG0508977.1 MAG: hypothetical protein E1N63_1874 [Limisphaerales bacterium]TXT51302.1 MAG: hypothetical protein FD140_1761 [Limisphaerales bacterium]
MNALTFKTVWRSENDLWTKDGEKITDERKLQTIRQVLDKTGPILVELWFYRGSRSPERKVIDDYDDFIEYLQQNAKAGDAIHVWDLDPLLRNDNVLVHGKCPAEDGTVPQKGAY